MASASATTAGSVDGFPAASTPYHLQRAETTAALCARYPSLTVPPLSRLSLSLHSRLRDQRTQTEEFVRTADHLLRHIVEAAISTLETKTVVVTTPTQTPFYGCELTREVVGVSIVRAGESFESALRLLLPSARLGKILIQRDESRADKPAHFFYAKMPKKNIQQANILLMDPMLASGGSAICAIQHLLSLGIPLSHLTFVCLISSPEGIASLLSSFPSLSLVTSLVDPQLDERKFILPGVGDFGDRYFGTVEQAEEEAEATGAEGGAAGARPAAAAPFTTSNATLSLQS